jgi:hypothetical protein
MPLKRLDELVKAAGSSPSPSDIEIIGRLADEHGMEYTQTTVKNKILPDSTEWKLVKKGTASAPDFSKAETGTYNGIKAYKVGNDFYDMNGKKLN